MSEKEVKNEVKSSGLAVVDDEEKEELGENSELREQIINAKQKADEDAWTLGTLLEQAYKEDAYRGWGFDSWKEYVEEELDIGIRKAQYLVKLQEWFDTMTPAIQKWMREMGWTKSRMLMHVVTQENAQEWRNRVADKTVAQIEEMLKAEKDGSGEGGEGGEDGGEPGENTSQKFSATLMGTQYDTVLHAIAEAKDKGETDKDGQALTLICIDYLATNTNINDKTDILKNLERVWGMNLVAIDQKLDEVVYGQEYLDAETASQEEEEDVVEEDAVEDATAGEEVEDAE